MRIVPTINNSIFIQKRPDGRFFLPKIQAGGRYSTVSIRLMLLLAFMEGLYCKKMLGVCQLCIS